MKDPLHLSTGKAANLAGVCTRTMAKWLDAGLLASWRLPNGHRRVTREELERWMDANKMPKAGE